MRKLTLAILTLTLVMNLSIYAVTLHVPADYETIQAAIDAAEDGDTVLVADGVYLGEGNRDIDFKGKAITLKSENGPGKTIIHCQSSGRGFYFHSGEDESSVVSGFTIKDGKVNKGGAIYCKDSSPTIENNIITNNSFIEIVSGAAYDASASAYGSGIYCSNSSPTISNNIITNNSITINIATVGRYNNASAHAYGGGIYCSDSSPTISNNIITNNSVTASAASNRVYASRSASAYGGGIYCSNSSLTINNNIITNNSVTANVSPDDDYNDASAYGGGIYCSNLPSTINNNVIMSNSVTSNDYESGGGIYCGGSVYPMVINTIIWTNSSPQISGDIGIVYSDVQGGRDDIGNIDADPLFVDPENGNYYLQTDSPCIDAGDPSSKYNDPDGTRNDMGAYGGPNAIIHETQPVIKEVSPDHGPTAGGTEVTITGENFVDGATVKFGENIASDIIVVSDTEITASTPATEEIGTVDAAVINPDGQSSVIRDAFTYEAKTLGTFTITFDRGLNMVSLPNHPDTPHTAKSFAEKIGEVTLLMRRYEGKFEAYLPTYDTDDGFSIEGGQGYIVNVTKAKNVDFTGTVWDNVSAAPEKSWSEIPTWAFVIAGNLPRELHGTTDLTISIASEHSQYATHTTQHSADSFRIAIIDEKRNAVVEAGDQLSIEVTDAEGRLVAEKQIMVDPADLANAYKITNLRYNPIPDRSALLQNYPNPFNPETWIPFKLSKSANVVISIYDVEGQLVRKIGLGRMSAGVYVSKDRAAYWDGRNSSGESVSSVIYFYHLKADDYDATKRMLILE